jgi:phosphate starvation-inducible PhoH-like protein
MELTIQVASQEEAVAVFGPGDRNLRLLRDNLPVQVTARNGVARFSGEQAPVETAVAVLNGLLSTYRSGQPLREDYVESELARLQLAAATAAEEEAEGGAPESQEAPTAELGEVELAAIRGLGRSPGQVAYIDAIVRHAIVFSIGPAGTGKTFLAVRMAVNALRSGEVRRLILCRPAVEAGEKLGFLPGDFQAKVNPYLRPLYDALNDILDYDQVKRYMEREIIEIIPLAYMRGRTLNNAFIILDEGQNTTILQMKMFLTRMGMNSRIVVNGDITQIDLPPGQPSGLIHARKIIRNIPGISWVELKKRDIVRHPLVKRIVEAYEDDEVED